jgi:hypothetical protein
MIITANTRRQLNQFFYLKNHQHLSATEIIDLMHISKGTYNRYRLFTNNPQKYVPDWTYDYNISTEWMERECMQHYLDHDTSDEDKKFYLKMIMEVWKTKTRSTFSDAKKTDSDIDMSFFDMFKPNANTPSQ